MQTKLSAAQINRLAQRLSEAPLGRSASAAKAGERFERLLAAKIGAERTASAAKSILGAPGFETAEGRLVAEIEGDAPELASEPSPAVEPAPEEIADPAPVPKAAPAPRTPRRRRDADLEARAREGELPAAPDFSAPTHARFRNRLGQITVLAEAGDIAGLRAVVINPVSSSPKAMLRYRDLCITALEARKGASA